MQKKDSAQSPNPREFSVKFSHDYMEKALHGQELFISTCVCFSTVLDGFCVF